MKVTICIFLAIQLALSVQNFNNLDIFNAEVDKEFRDFLKGRNLNDKKQKERFLKENVKENKHNKKPDRKLPKDQKQLDDLVQFLLTETDPNKYQPPAIHQDPKDDQVQLHSQQQVVQTLEAEHQHQINVHKQQPKQPVVVSSNEDKKDLMNFFEELLGKDNWVDKKSKKLKKQPIEPEDDSEDPEHNHHWQQKHMNEKSPVVNKDIGDIPIDHDLFKIVSNGQQQKPKHMQLNQQIFDNTEAKDSFNLENHNQINENVMHQQTLEQMVQKLTHYEHILKQENQTSTKTKQSILLLLQQISNQFHLPQKFQQDIKMLFEQDGLQIDNNLDESQIQKIEQEKKMNEILGLIGFNNLSTLEENSIHDESQNLNDDVQNPLNIKNDIDHILEQYLQEKQQRDHQIQPNDNQKFQNPLLVLGELLDDSKHDQPQNLQDQIMQTPQLNEPIHIIQQEPDNSSLQNQIMQTPQLNEPIHIIQQDPDNSSLLNQQLANEEQINPMNNNVELEGKELQNIVDQLQMNQELLDQNPDQIQKNDEEINMVNQTLNDPLLNQNQPIQKQFLDQDAPVAIKDDQNNVIEFKNSEEALQKNQENTNLIEQHNAVENKEQMHHFTITLNDEDKGTKNVYKIHCMKGNCEKEDKDSPLEIEYHSSDLRLI